MTHSVCHTFIYKVQPLEKLGQSFWLLPLMSKALLKRLALETLDVSWECCGLTNNKRTLLTKFTCFGIY